MVIQVPVTTEVIEKNEALHPSGRAEDKRLIIEFDTRKRNYHKLLNLKRKVKISWTDERTFDVQELSGLAWPILYRVTTATGYYTNGAGERVYFTPEIKGLSTQRKVSDVVMRLGVFLCIIAGLGSRKASWLMNVLYDYFHILQNVWRKVWDVFRTHRRDLKERSEAAQTKWYAKKLKQMAAQLWKNRYIFFKSDENLSEKEKQTMQEVLNTQSEMSFLRGFLNKVWAIFEGTTTEVQAQIKLAELKQYVAHQENNGYTKSISFLEEHFKNMTTFLRVPGVKRNSFRVATP